MNLPSGEHHERALEAAAAKAGAFWIARESIIAYFTELERQGVRPVYVPKCKPCDGSGERYGDGYESDIGPCPDCGGTGFERVVPLAEIVAALREYTDEDFAGIHVVHPAKYIEDKFGGGERCSTCGGRGWHTAGGNDPAACGSCEAGEVWAEGER